MLGINLWGVLYCLREDLQESNEHLVAALGFQIFQILLQILWLSSILHRKRWFLHPIIHRLLTILSVVQDFATTQDPVRENPTSSRVRSERRDGQRSAGGQAGGP